MKPRAEAGVPAHVLGRRGPPAAAHRARGIGLTRHGHVDRRPHPTRNDFAVGAASSRTVTFLPEPEPCEPWATILSADDHVVEPPDVFDGRFSARFADAAPCDRHRRRRPGMAVARPRRCPTLASTRSPAVHRKSCRSSRSASSTCAASWDVQARLHDMDLNGVWASVCFPSSCPGSWGSGSRSGPTTTRSRLRRCACLYNDWHLEAWCGADLERFVPQQIAYLRERDRGRRGDPAQRGAWVQGSDVLRGAVQARPADDPQRLLGPVLRCVRGDRDGDLPARRVRGRDADDLSRRATPRDRPPLRRVGVHVHGRLALLRCAHALPDIKICMSEGASDGCRASSTASST